MDHLSRNAKRLEVADQRCLWWTTSESRCLLKEEDDVMLDHVWHPLRQARQEISVELRWIARNLGSCDATVLPCLPMVWQVPEIASSSSKHNGIRSFRALGCCPVFPPVPGPVDICKVPLPFLSVMPVLEVITCRRCRNGKQTENVDTSLLVAASDENGSALSSQFSVTTIPVVRYFIPIIFNFKIDMQTLQLVNHTGRR